jgi:ATP:ADP antiporter, AAA family
MFTSLLKKLNIEKQEVGFISLLFLSALLLGAYLSIFDIVTHAIFFQSWNQEDMLKAYVISGVFGVFLFFIYTILHKRISFQRFYFICLLIILFFTLTFFGCYYLIPDRMVSFAGLVIMFPLNLLSLLNFWRYYRKLLKPIQTRRIFPILDTGVAFGIMGSALTVILLLQVLNFQILGFLACFIILILFFLQFPVNYSHKNNPILEHRIEQLIPVRSSLFHLWSTKYTRFLLLFTLISSIMGFYLHFGYMNLMKIRYYEIDTLTNYYSLYIGAMFMFIWIVQHFLVHRILYTHDSPYSLVLLPVGLALFFIISLVGLLIIKKGNFNDPLPLLIILFGVNKIVYETSKNVIQLPSFHSLYKTLDIRFLQIIYPRIEGMIVMFGMTITGLLLIVVYSFMNDLFLFLGLGLIITLAWFYLAVKLVKGYKEALQGSYRKLRISHTGDQHTESYTEKIRKILVSDDPVKVINAMRLSAAIEPLTYEKSLQRMLANPQPVIQGHVLQCIKDESLIELLPELKKLPAVSDESSDLLKRIIYEFELKEKVLSQPLNLEKMVNSRVVKERVLAAEIIGARKDVTYTSALVNLTREFEPEVKIAAVKAMARMSVADHSYLLMEFLSSPEYQAYAFEALVQIGDPALDYLERLFISPDTDDNILSRVIRIYGKIGSIKAIELLLNKLDNQSRRITLAAIASLHEANFQANATNVHRILNVIVRIINIMGMNYLVINSLPENESFRELKLSYREEIDNNTNMLFDLLSLAYNPRTIREIRELLENGSSADISHAIEMLDHFVYEDIKPILFPVVESISSGERVKRLQYYFAIEDMTTQEIISATLSRDYNMLSFYPRICAMHVALEMPEFEVNQELIANLFHPNRLLREVAAPVVFKKDPELFENVLERVDEKVRFELKETIGAFEKGNKLLLVDKYNLLRNTDRFIGLPEWNLIELAHNLEERKFTPDQVINIADHFKDYSLFIIANGAVHFDGIQQKIATHSGQYILYYSEILMNAGISKITFSDETVMLSINHETVQLLLNDYFDIANSVLSCVELFKLAG